MHGFESPTPGVPVVSMTECRECHRAVSTQASACPHCGAPQPADSGWGGTGYEWKSEATFVGVPWVHVAWGRDANGRRRVAKGVVAVGQFAVGAVTIAQFGIGVVFGFGQFVAGLTAVGQFAGGALFGLGQFASGEMAVGQFAAGVWVLAQFGLGRHVWSLNRKDPEAIEFFRALGEQVGLF